MCENFLSFVERIKYIFKSMRCIFSYTVPISTIDIFIRIKRAVAVTKAGSQKIKPKTTNKPKQNQKQNKKHVVKWQHAMRIYNGNGEVRVRTNHVHHATMIVFRIVLWFIASNKIYIFIYVFIENHIPASVIV